MADSYSINTGQKNVFSIADYVLFGLTLALSAGVGLFYAIKDRNKVDSKEYLIGGGQMSVIPVAMSLLVTSFSALMLLGMPAEMYNFNTMYCWLCLSVVLAIFISGAVFIPFFFNLRITSIFQYLEMRFNKSVRTMGVIFFLTPVLTYMAFVLYAPSLALNAVTGLSLWGSVIGVGAVATLYTSLGGMKAVLWTDTFQALIIVAGLLAVLIQGSSAVGGFQNAWEIANNRSRIVFDDFSFDPSTRHSFWSVVIGGGFLWMSLYGCNQAQIQRTLSLPAVRKARMALFINLSGLIFIITLCSMIGIVMFAFYSDCHPLKFNNLISRTDQLLPLFVLDVLANVPGLPGVLVSSIFSGSLSTLSSGLNAVSAIVPMDLIRPYFCKTLTDRSFIVMSKVIVFIFGGLIIAVTFVVANLGNVLQAAISVSAAIGSPLVGTFMLGMFFPWANSWGAVVGTLTSSAFSLWICIGAFVHRASSATYSPVFTHGCNWNVTTTTTSTLATLSTSTLSTPNSTPEGLTLAKSSDPFYPMYTVSYLYYSPIAATVTVIVGLIVSFITGRRDPSSLDPRLICPLFDELFPFLPEMILKYFRCGMNHNGKYDVPLKVRDQDEVVTGNGLSEKRSMDDDKKKEKHRYIDLENGATKPKDEELNKQHDNLGFEDPVDMTRL